MGRCLQTGRYRYHGVEHMKIGYSLSFCVKDIIQEKVNIDDVLCIVSGIHCRTPRDVDEVLNQYTEVYWRGNKSLAETILMRLARKDKLIMPKVYNIEPPNISQLYWKDVDPRDMAMADREQRFPVTVDDVIYGIIRFDQIYIIWNHRYFSWFVSPLQMTLTDIYHLLKGDYYE